MGFFKGGKMLPKLKLLLEPIKVLRGKDTY